MQTDRNAFLTFLLGSLWPFIAFVLFLSIGLNAFFLTVDRFRQANIPQATSSSVSIQAPSANGSDPFARGPQAFGKVWRGFPVRPQRAVAGVALTPVKTYELSPDLLPTISATMTLYRDQGIDIDPSFVLSIFSRFGSPLTAEPGQYFARTVGLKSADASTDVTLDVDRRILTVTVKNASPAPAQASRADDAEVIAIAKQFASSIGIDASLLGTPTVIERMDGTSKTIVSWNAMFAGAPLFDMNMKPVPALEIQVGRVSHRPVVAWVNLLRPDLLTRSEYPAASRDFVGTRLGSGGFLPVAKDLPGKAGSVTYTSAVLGYVLQPADAEYPLYVIPVIRASWMADLGCKGCVPQEVATFVPALDAKTFSWFPEKRPPVEQVVPKPDPSGENPGPVSSASGSVIKK